MKVRIRDDKRLKATSKAWAIVGLGAISLPAFSAPTSSEWNVDHHMHLASPALCRRVDDCLASNTPAAVLASDAVMALDRAHVANGVILSCAYLFGMKSLHVPRQDIALLTRQENEFTAEQVEQYSNRLIGFFSVDPLQPSAIAEIHYWQSNSRLVGLKLHLRASGVNLRDPGHRRQLAAAMRAASDRESPMVIHVGGGDFDAEDAELFIRRLLPVARRSWVQIAHLGGGEPNDDKNSLRVLKTFADHIVRGDPATKRVLFDIAYIPMPETLAMYSRDLMRQLRRIGFSRLLFGSDFNIRYPADEIEQLGRLGLTDGEMTILRKKCAPWTCPFATQGAVMRAQRLRTSRTNDVFLEKPTSRR